MHELGFYLRIKKRKHLLVITLNESFTELLEIKFDISYHL